MENRRKKKRWHGVLLVILAVIGIAVMAYPFAASFLNGLKQTETIDGYLSETANATALEQEAMLQEAREYNANLFEAFHAGTDAFLSAMERYDEILACNDAGMIGYIEIPAIDVYLPIYHGTGNYALQNGVGHVKTSSFPVGGINTRAVLSAHTGLPQSKLFTDLDELEIGDTFTITVLRNTVTYEVFDIEVVLPEEINSLAFQEGADLCTLVTCTPYGINTHRLLVHGTRVEPAV